MLSFQWFVGNMISLFFTNKYFFNPCAAVIFLLNIARALYTILRLSNDDDLHYYNEILQNIVIYQQSNVFFRTNEILKSNDNLMAHKILVKLLILCVFMRRKLWSLIKFCWLFENGIIFRINTGENLYKWLVVLIKFPYLIDNWHLILY